MFEELLVHRYSGASWTGMGLVNSIFWLKASHDERGGLTKIIDGLK